MQGNGPRHREAYRTQLGNITKVWDLVEYTKEGQQIPMSEGDFEARTATILCMVQPTYDMIPASTAVAAPAVINHVTHNVLNPEQVDENDHKIFDRTHSEESIFNVISEESKEEWPESFDFQELSESYPGINAVTLQRAANRNAHITCHKCGKKGHYQSECGKCYKCGEAGHFANKCTKGGTAKKTFTPNFKRGNGFNRKKSLFVKKYNDRKPYVATIDLIEAPDCEAVFQVYQTDDGDDDFSKVSVFHNEENFWGA